MTFSPECAMNSGGRMMVVMPYQLNPKGTIRTTGGFFAMSGGAVKKGLNLISPAMGSPLPPLLKGVVGPVGSPNS